MSVRQLVSGSGEEQPTLTVRDDRRMSRSRSERPINAQGSGRRAYVLKRVPRRSLSAMRAPYFQAHPLGVQLGVGLVRSARR